MIAVIILVWVWDYASSLRIREQYAEHESLIDEFSQDYLHRQALNLHKHYLTAEPFPHIVLDDFFPEAVINVLRGVSAEYPDREADSEGCLHNEWEMCFSEKGVLRNLFEGGSFIQLSGALNSSSFYKEDIYKKGWAMDQRRELGKNTNDIWRYMKPLAREMFHLFHDKTWRSFLANLTGIEDLLADKNLLNGAGIHGTTHGGHLDVHADFNHNHDTERLLHRRVNMFLFLNEDWKEEYGGHLELWSRDLKKCEKRILPVFGRLVIFTTNDYSYHGHPHPLNAPGRVRRSLAQYYYTEAAPPKNACIDDCSGTEHSTLWQDPECVCPLAGKASIFNSETSCSDTF